MAVYPISQLLDLAHSPLVVVPEALKDLDTTLFQPQQRHNTHQPGQPREARARGKNSQWKKPAWDMPLEETTQPAAPKSQSSESGAPPGMEFALKGHAEPAEPKEPVTESKPKVELWEASIPTFQKKDGASRFSSLFTPGTGAGPAGPAGPSGPSGPAHGHAGHTGPPIPNNLMGMLRPSQPPLDMASLQGPLSGLSQGLGQGPQPQGQGQLPGPPIPPVLPGPHAQYRQPHSSPGPDLTSNDVMFFNSLLSRSQPSSATSTPSKPPGMFSAQAGPSHVSHGSPVHGQVHASPVHPGQMPPGMEGMYYPGSLGPGGMPPGLGSPGKQMLPPGIYPGMYYPPMPRMYQGPPPGQGSPGQGGPGHAAPSRLQ